MFRALTFAGCLLSLVVAAPASAGEGREGGTGSTPTEVRRQGDWTLAALAADWRWRQEVAEKLEGAPGDRDQKEGAAAD